MKIPSLKNKKVTKPEAAVKVKEVTVKKPQPQNSWYVFDAKEKVLGRLASQVAKLLAGKNSATWAPHIDPRINVIVVNATKIEVTGNKELGKKYYRYSGYPGGLRVDNLAKLRKDKPEEIFKHAVKGMLPKNKLAAKMLGRLFIYPGADHGHQAQKPVEVK